MRDKKTNWTLNWKSHWKEVSRWITDNTFNLRPRYDAQTEETRTKLYRLDKDEEYSTLTTLWSNMAKLFKGDSDIDAQLRRQVVDLEPPVFSRKRRNDTVRISSQTSDITEYFTQQTPWVSLLLVKKGDWLNRSFKCSQTNSSLELRGLSSSWGNEPAEHTGVKM